MSQLRLASVNLRIVSTRTRPSSKRSEQPPENSTPWPAVALKAKRLQEQRPGAAAVIEELLDDLLREFAS